MLYINATVNSTAIKAFVDSGAQQTIMSESCAKRCNLMRLLDTRFHGIAQGVGTAKILGRVHLAPIQIGKSFFPCTFTILEDQGIEFLLGLDFLRRFQCQIDLKANCLRIGEEAVEFLPEKDIPTKERANELTEKQIAEIERREIEEASQRSRDEKPTHQPTQTSSPSVSNRPPQVSASSHPEEKVQPLMGLGYPRETVLAALDAAGGNADLAASILLGS
jgi:DNA damage-inducible protein 1